MKFSKNRLRGISSFSYIYVNNIQSAPSLIAMPKKAKKQPSREQASLNEHHPRNNIHEPNHSLQNFGIDLLTPPRFTNTISFFISSNWFIIIKFEVSWILKDIPVHSQFTKCYKLWWKCWRKGVVLSNVVMNFGEIRRWILEGVHYH